MAKIRRTGRQIDAVSAPLERASKVLSLISQAPQGLRAIEIAERLNLPQPTAYRLVRRLEKIGYLECNGRDLEYSIGPSLRDLARSIHANRPVELIVDTAVQSLADSTGMSGFLAARTGTRVVLLAARTPSFAEGASILPGNRFPAHATASGRAILAFQTDETIEQYLQHARLERLTERTISTSDKLMEELMKIRKAGFATMRGELGNGLWALASPVPADGPPLFALGIVTFEAQIKPGGDRVNKLAQVVKEAAEDLREVLAGPTAPIDLARSSNGPRRQSPARRR